MDPIPHDPERDADMRCLFGDTRSPWRRFSDAARQSRTMQVIGFAALVAFAPVGFAAGCVFLVALLFTGVFVIGASGWFVIAIGALGPAGAVAELVSAVKALVP